MLPDSLKKFIDLFSSLPSIGPRLATRLAFYLIRQGKAAIIELGKAVGSLGYLKTCSQCFFPYESGYEIRKEYEYTKNGLCKICSDKNRRQNVIAIVEKETDLLSLEKTRKFNGRYLVLGELSKDGILNPEQKLRLNSLKGAIQKQFGPPQSSGQAEEIIIALNPTTLGDMEAGLIIQELKPFARKITRLGRGLPTGGEIEFADEDTLGGALDNRR